MAIRLLPIPPRELINMGRPVALYFQELDRLLNSTEQIEWDRVDKSGSNLTDLATRNHNDLQNMQGGTTNEYYHLTDAVSDSVQGVLRQSIATDYVSDYDDGIIVVDASGGAVEVTLPLSQGDFKKMMVSVQTGGFDVTVTPSGSDTINGDANLVIEYEDSTAQLASVTGGWLVV